MKAYTLSKRLDQITNTRRVGAAFLVAPTASSPDRSQISKWICNRSGLVEEPLICGACYLIRGIEKIGFSQDLFDNTSALFLGGRGLIHIILGRDSIHLGFWGDYLG